MKIRYRWSDQFQVWIRVTEVCDPGTYPYWLAPQEVA